MTLRTTIPTIEDELREEMNRVAMIIHEAAGKNRKLPLKMFGYQDELRCINSLKMIF